MVFATAVRLLGRGGDAEDVAQTVFLRAFERFAGLADSPAVAGGLRTGTRNPCLNHLKRQRARWRLFSEGGPEASGPSPEERIARRAAAPDELERIERAERLEQALRNLPEQQRVPLVLFHFEEMAYQEIADLLGISLAKVKTDIHRGREALRQTLDADHDRR